jgi:hypothetical protein
MAIIDSVGGALGGAADPKKKGLPNDMFNSIGGVLGAPSIRPQMQLTPGQTDQAPAPTAAGNPVSSDWFAELSKLSPRLAQQVKNEQKQVGEFAMPIAPGTDPRLEALKNKQAELAHTYRQSMPAMERTQTADLRGDTARGLQKQVSDLRGDAQGRGLLYSGLRGGAEAGARRSAAMNVASGRAGIRQNLENTATGIEQNAVGAGLGMAGMNTGAAQFNQVANQAAENRAQQYANNNNQMYGQIGGGLGTAIGGIVSGLRKK